MKTSPTKNFKTKLGDGFIELPFDARKEFGKARCPVKISINGYSFESTVAVYGAKYYVPVRKQRQEAAGVHAGELVDVTIAPDTKTRAVKVPAALAAVLAKNAGAKARWDALSYTHQREHAEAILEAKKPETRARRIQKVLTDLAVKAR